MTEKPFKYDLVLDAPFDKKLIQNVEIWIGCMGGTDFTFLSEVLKITYHIMME